MYALNRRMFAIITCFAVILAGCGDFDTLFPSNGSYRVSAMVDGYSLDTCSIIGMNSQIQPYFINPINNDPDITGLAVFLQNQQGEVISQKVRYILVSELSSYTQDTQESDVASDTKILDTDIHETSETQDTGLQSTGTPETIDSQKTQDVSEPKNPVAANDPSKSSSTDTDTVSGNSLGDFGENAATMSVIREKKTPAIVQSRYDDTLIPVARLDEKLPSFSLPKDLNIGQYMLVFQALGERGVLSRIEKNLYYLADAEFAFNDIQTYLPGLMESSHIVPPGMNIMLEAQIVSDPRLDPYVIWYNGKKRINEGFLSGGADRVMWKTPEQIGFHALRVEAFPFQPRRGTANLAGKTRELSLPVSSKFEGKAFFTGAAEKPARWYHLWGNLRDAVNPEDTGKSLLSEEKAREQWLPYAGIYGLSIGPGHIYTIPGMPFNLPDYVEDDVSFNVWGVQDMSRGIAQGSGKILLHFIPLSAGTIFSGSFTLTSSPNTLDVDLSYKGNQLILTYALENQSQSQTLSLDARELGGFITTVINFKIEQNRFFAGLSLKTADTSMMEQEIVLNGLINGERGFRLGAEKSRKSLEKNAGNSPADGALKSGVSNATVNEPANDVVQPIEPANAGDTTTENSLAAVPPVSLPVAVMTNAPAVSVVAAASTVNNAANALGWSNSPVAILDEIVFVFNPAAPEPQEEAAVADDDDDDADNSPMPQHNVAENSASTLSLPETVAYNPALPVRISDTVN